MRGQSLKNLVESNGIPWVCGMIDQAMELGREERRQHGRVIDGLAPDHFSIRELAESFMGEQWVRRLNPANARYLTGTVALAEAGEAVDVTAFSNITGQIFFNRILDGWETAAALGDQLVETIKTDLDGEKMPWISPPLADEGKIHTGMPYPEAGLAEEYIETPSLDTYGRILSIHKLTIFYDRTGMMLRQANKLGERMRKAKNRRILNHFLGVSGTPLFKWKGVSYNPYQTAGTYWTNDFTGLPLVDFTSLEQVEIAATKVLEPDLQNTGINEPIEINFDTIVVMPFKKWTTDRILTSTQVRGLNLGPTPNIVTIGPSPVDKQYKVIADKQLYQQAIGPLGLSPAAAQDLWFMLDSKRKPIAYMEAWPMTLVQAPPQSTAEFERDIVFRIKASERGVTAWIDPRYSFRMKNAAA